jgi:hypothetical protein
MLLCSIVLLLLTGCEEKPKFTVDLSNFFNVDKNITYIYKMVDTHEINGKVEPFMSERYMEKDVMQANNNCINIQSYVLFSNKDIEQMDKRLRAELKDNKLRALDEKYCIVGNTITINGETCMNLDKEWSIVSESILSDGSKPTENKAECKVVDVSEKIVLGSHRKIIHTQCTMGKLADTVDWFFAEKIGLYKVEMIATFPEYHSQSKNEIILINKK